MDERTVRAYDQAAPEFARRYRQLAPERIYELGLQWFHPGARTGDIGCGSGRDVAWLSERGFSVVGYDASERMLAEARAAYPGLEFRDGRLPELATVEDGSLDNLLCLAVLMHLPADQLPEATRSLARVLRPGGRLLQSYLHGQTDEGWEADGRWFTGLPQGEIVALLESTGFEVLFAELRPDQRRAGITWETAVAERRVPGARRASGVVP